MSKEIIKVLDAICEKFGLAIDWTSENVVPYVKKLFEKYVVYEVATSVAWIFLFAALTIGMFFIVKKLWKMYSTPGDLESSLSEEEIEIFMTISTVVFAILGFVTVIATGFQIMNIITALTFPEKMILREMQNITGTA